MYGSLRHIAQYLCFYRLLSINYLFSPIFGHITLFAYHTSLVGAYHQSLGVGRNKDVVQAILPPLNEGSCLCSALLGIYLLSQGVMHMVVLVLPKDIKQQVLTFLYLSYNHMQS